MEDEMNVDDKQMERVQEAMKELGYDDFLFFATGNGQVFFCRSDTPPDGIVRCVVQAFRDMPELRQVFLGIAMTLEAEVEGTGKVSASA
jgi:hypothetical protein